MLTVKHHLAWGPFVVWSMLGCSNDPELTQPAQQGGRGESCQARNDCREGLACISGHCSQNDFPISVSAKQCDLIQCSTKDDCCKNFVQQSSCATWQSNCSAGDQTSCGYVAQYCQCQMDCVQGKCAAVNTCTTDADCFSGLGNFCVNGTCASCRTDTDCGSNFQCVSGTCKTGCTKNEECPLLQTCEGGKCVESGCQSDRECIGVTKNRLAKCVDKKCSVACENDGECDVFEACQSGTCVFIGCETNDECRYLLDNFTPSSNVTAVCQ